METNLQEAEVSSEVEVTPTLEVVVSLAEAETPNNPQEVVFLAEVVTLSNPLAVVSSEEPITSLNVSHQIFIVFYTLLYIFTVLCYKN